MFARRLRLVFQGDRMPGYRPDIEDEAPPRSGAPGSLQLSDPAAPHLLIVDDNETNRMVCATLCKMFDYTFECAVDGVEAVEAAQRSRFDLILMDINMPRMDGIEAARAILALPRAPRPIPILAVTTDTGVQESRRYLAAGMVDVVSKPLNPAQLIQSIAAALASVEECPAISG
jgi:CheY-like chemotaxis protein